MATLGIARRIADEVGVAVDEVQPAVDDMSQAQAEATLAALRGDDLSFGQRALAQTGRIAADQPSRAVGGASEAFSSAFKVGVPATAAAAGGAFASGKFFESKEAEYLALAREDQAEAIKRIMSDSELSAGQKADLLNRLARQGFFTGARQKPGEQTIIDRIGGLLNLGQANFMEWVVILIVLYFVGNALVEYVGSRGGGA